MLHRIIPVLILLTIANLSYGQNQDGCQECSAFGISRKPNTLFRHEDGCLEYTCNCDCDGKWKCPRELTKNTCQGECRTCSAGGETRKGGEPFQFEEGCYQFNCFCRCDGSWNCPKEKTEDFCNKNLTTGCYYCDVYGTRYQGNSEFKHVNGCIEYACVCNCDGSWNCPGEYAVDTCSINKESGCYYCNVHGDRYEGNSYFKHTNGCIEYDCVCNCDGSWNCPGENAVDRCMTNSATGCYYCSIDNYLYEGNSIFPLVRDCYLYQCECGCDGGWTCKNSIGEYYCDENGNVLQECKSCNIDGNIFFGDSRFFFQKGCIKYICTCDCAGRFHCSGDEARLTCDDVEISIIPSLNSSIEYSSVYKSGGGYRSNVQSVGGNFGKIENSRVEKANDCKPCTVNSETYDPESSFDIVSGCELVQCQCSCDGSIKCPTRKPIKDCDLQEAGRLRSRAQSQAYGSVVTRRDADVGVAVDTCLECKHAGVTYESLSTFEYESDCWRYKCNCRCNGSYDCASEDSKYICTGPVTCTKCKVSENQIFEPNTEFSLEQGCFKFDKCKCNCDGGWNCEDGEYTCERCQGCRVDGQRYAGNSTFSLTRGCDYYAKCSCGCDGKWSCEADGLKDLCGKCRKCKIGDEYYDGGNSRFSVEVGCTRYRSCSCDCDGTFACRRGVYTCSERSDQPVDGLCDDCVHGDRRFVPGQSFDYEDGCSQYRGCECKCGTTHCQQVVNTCGECRSCEINGTEYRGGTEFSLQVGCRLYRKCDCFCNSKWKCYGESAIDSCNTCRKCNVNGTIYEPFSRFTLDQRCWKYQCFCGCDGSTRCPSETVINTCNTPDDCRSCEVNGQTYRGNTHFEYTMNGMTMSCRCNCDGSYICFAEWLYERLDFSISGSGIGSGGQRCFSCELNGLTYRGNSKFKIQRSDIDLDCQCFCNGGYYCFGKKVFDGGCRSCRIFGQRYIGDSSFDMIFNGLPLNCQCACDGSYVCYGSKGEVIITCIDGRCLSDTCGKCSVKGEVFEGGSGFGTYYKGIRLECRCGCDGSYYCEGRGGFGLSCVGGQCTEVGCTSCNVFGESYQGDSEFEIIYQGLKLNCGCRCGGSYRCVGSSMEVIVSCDEDGTGCLPGTCTYCNVNGRRLAGRSTFRYDYNGIQMECVCACDGSYYCQGRSLTELIEIACVGGVCKRIGCGGCNIYGRNYAGESSFPIIYGGIKLQCECACNGNYVCAGAAGQVIVSCNDGVGCLSSTCRQCLVNGRRYDGGSTFMSSYKGVEISCTCGCDGTSYCVGVSTSIEVSCVGGSCARIGCKECVIFGEEYLGSSSIDFIYNGLPVTCTCDCNGGYICRSNKDQTPVIVCEDGIGQDCLGYRCRSCEIDGKRYDGNSRFDYTHNGIEMTCQCSCDSSYYCKGVREKIELSCVGGECTALGCKTCQVYGKEIPGASSFQIVYVGLLLNCQCRCDGSYECFGSDRISVFRCRNNRGTCLTRPCRTCNFNGRQFEGNSVFTDTYKGVPVSCTCGCDSSIFCTGEGSLTLTCIGGRCTPEGCQDCRIFGKSYEGISSFPLVYSGYMLNCQCDCSGSYICQGEVSLECKGNRGAGCLPQICNNCQFNGNLIQGMDTFKYKYQDYDMSCTCGCDGNVYCNGVTSNIELRCLGDNCSPIGCTSCRYFDQEIPPFGSFNIVHQGVRLDCTCSCTGYRCTGGSGEVVIDCGSGNCSPSKCAQCVVNGNTYEAFQKFRSVYRGIDLKCECGCDGSAFCTGVRESIEVSCIGGTCTPRNCESCSVFGREYASFSDFNIVYQGTELDCECSCDSSYICRGSTGNVVIDCDGFGRNCLPSTCTDCIVNGVRRIARQKFPHVFEGIELECECGCDGSSHCRGKFVEITVSCIGEKCSPVGCKSCKIFGEEYRSPSSFDIIYRGTRLGCKCSCDSSYVCAGSTGEVVIECQAGQSCLPNTCQNCVVNGNTYTSYTKFPYRYKGIDMRCECGCDGSSYCKGVNISYEVSCIGNRCSPTSCGTCSIFGIERQGDTSFPLIYRGSQLQCKCECDTSYRCVGTSPEEPTIECGINEDCIRDRCRKCRVNRRRYDGGERFDFTWNNYEMSCECGCDGSYYCQGKSSDVKIACARQRNQGCKQIGGCRSCNIFGTEYPGGSNNRFVYQGYFMTCNCKCDSSYECLGVRNEVITSCPADGDCLSNCRECQVDGKRFPGNTVFETVYQGKNMECTCGCDGSYFCRCKDDGSEISCDIRNTCTWVGCNTCRSDNRDYQAYSEFTKVYDNIEMNCQCNCDGSYRCTGQDVRITVICNGDSCNLVGCRSCVENGRERPYGAEFYSVKSGKRHRCRCECDGSISCTEIKERACKTCTIYGKTYPGHTRHRVYRNGDSYICDCYCDGKHKCELESKGCGKCRINGRDYNGNTRFSTVMEGKRVVCRCECNGVYECTGDGIVCTSAGGCRSTCAGCEIEGKRYSGGTNFKIFHRGHNMEMDCECQCGGSYECRGESVVCTSANGCQDTCSGCEIEGKTYRGDSTFRIFHRGHDMEMTCNCQCGGSYECRGGTVVCTSSGGCRDTCSGCDIEGTSYRGDSTFTIFHRGQNLNMECSCKCGGSYECRGGTVICTSSGGCRDTCSDCDIEGASYRGDSTFTIFHRGQNLNMECSCKCGGSYECRGGTVVCTSSGGCRNTCSGCDIEGTSYRGDSTFTIFHRGQNLNMECSCKCGGSYECRGGTVVCTSSGGCRDTCSGCDIEGTTYRGDTTFTIYHRGQRMNMECNCECGGSYECKGGTVLCTSSDGCYDRCSGCEIEGKTYRGDSTFAIFHRGQNMNMECSCECGGSYECKGGTVVCTSSSGCRDTCIGCQIEGATYKGGTTFRMYHQGQNMNMECTCQCGGSYECRGGTVICTQAGCTDTCSGCEIEGKTYEGGTSFKIFHRSFNVNMDCNCQCGGSYECRGETAICTSSGGCQNLCPGCEIEGVTYKGGTNFRIFHRGHNMNMDCSCQCGGSYECRGESLICTSSGCQDTCSGCEIEGTTYKGGTSFKIFHRGYDMDMDCSCQCGGSYTCKGVRYTESCIGPGCPQPGCRDCEYKGKRYPGNSRFDTVIDGINVQCTCDCGGNLNCTGSVDKKCSGPDCCYDCNVDGEVIRSRTRFQREQDGEILECTCNCDGGIDCKGTSRICPGPRCGTLGCRRCVINGRQYSGNTRFTIDDKDFQMSCSCYCDGSYSCTSSSGVSHSCLGKDCADNVCRKCQLDGKSYSVDTKFRLQKNDLVMNCVCECDGAYRCFSISGSCVGDQCDEYGCSSCNIDGKLYKGGSQFELKPGTICSCSCSGEFDCRTSSLVLECVGENCGVGGCKSCNVDGKLKTGNERFQFRDYGLFMECVCNCDSSFICRGYQIIGSRDNVDRNCRQCQIDGRLYNGNTRFQALINGERKVCACDCSGRHSCTGASQECRDCVVGGEKYQANSPFTLYRNANSIQCRCGCTGDFVCEGRREYPVSVGECRDCYIFGSRYKSNQKFTTEVGGVRMLCECFCNGGYSCKGYRSVTDVILPAEPRDVCNSCIVNDKEYAGRSRFKIDRGCFRISCLCACDGSWECPTQTPGYICGDEREVIERYDFSLSGSLVYANDPLVSESASRLIPNLESPGSVSGAGTCRSCFVQDQEFKGNTGFTLQDGCLRFTCSCDCYGGWNCTSVEGADCSFQDPFRNPAPLQRQIYDPDKGTCRQCVLGKDSYNVDDTFKLVENCIQYTCKCECNGSYYCPGSSAVRVCRQGSGSRGRLPGSGSRTLTQTGRTFVAIRPSASGSVSGGGEAVGKGGYQIVRQEVISPDGVAMSGIPNVQGGAVGGEAMVGAGADDKSAFSKTVYTQYSSVSGGSGGQGASRAVDGGVAYSDDVEADRSGGGSIDLSSLLTGGGRCDDCIVDGQSVRGGRDFTYRSGCTEHLCECFCNGTYVCPDDKKTNFCDKRGRPESPMQGCKVGNRVYKMNLFSYTENCLKYSCRCYKDGRYKCDPRKTRKVC